MRVNFFAQRSHYIDHIAPIWQFLPDRSRGGFYVSADLEAYARAKVKDQIRVFDKTLPDDFPTLVCGYGDLIRATRNGKKVIYMEHGVGHAFGTAAYPDGPGKRDYAALFLMPNQYTADKALAVRKTPCEVIGTPKMDRILAQYANLLS